jgi:tRNA(fMet)-specific endonuclease VapC
MDKVLLDTDIFSEVLKGRNQVVARNAAAYRQHFGHYTLSAITVMEVVKGFQKAQRPDRIQSLLASLVTEEILPLDQDAAELAGRIYGELERKGQPIGRADPMVAAIALQHKLVLVTGNMNHFERILNLGFALSLHDWRK